MTTTEVVAFWPVRVIARNRDGAKVEEDVPFRIR